MHFEGVRTRKITTTNLVSLCFDHRSGCSDSRKASQKALTDSNIFIGQLDMQRDPRLIGNSTASLRSDSP